MFHGSKMKKFVAILAIVMVSSFAIAGIIFVGEYGKNGFTGLEDSIRPANAIDVNEEKTEDLSGIKNIKVSTSSDDITFIPTDTNEVKAHFHGYYKSSNKDYQPEFTVTSAGDELTIKVTYKPNVGAISFTSDLKLDIYLPRSYSDNLQINTSSARVTIDELNLNNFICQRTSGDLKARLVNSKNAQLGVSSGSTQISGKYETFVSNSTSGDFSTEGITAENVTLKTSSGSIRGEIKAGTILLGSTSGDITTTQLSAKNCTIGTSSGSIRGSVSSDNIILGSTSGDITLEQLSTNKCTVSTSSGKTTLKAITGEIEATSTSGDISLEYKEYNYNIKIGTSSGRTEIKLPPNPEFALSYKTSSGDGRCDFPVTIKGTQKRNNLEGVVTSDRNSITVTSSSGDLRITEK